MRICVSYIVICYWNIRAVIVNVSHTTSEQTLTSPVISGDCWEDGGRGWRKRQNWFSLSSTALPLSLSTYIFPLQPRPHQMGLRRLVALSSTDGQWRLGRRQLVALSSVEDGKPRSERLTQMSLTNYRGGCSTVRLLYVTRSAVTLCTWPGRQESGAARICAKEQKDVLHKLLSSKNSWFVWTFLT